MVYLDNHTLTQACGPALERFSEPLSAVKSEMIYDLLGASLEHSFHFAASGAEAINQVHWTAFVEMARKEGKCHFITSAIEDAPTLLSLKRLEELGCFVKIAPVDAQGRIDVAKLSELIGARTAMISVSWAQGLTGVVQPIEEIGELAKAKGVLLHVDATYAAGKMVLSFDDLGIDYLTISGDRIHSVRSSGGLMVKKGRPHSPLILGAPLDTASFAALGAAASQASLSLDLMSLETARLRDKLETALTGFGAKPLYADQLRLPNTTALLFHGVHQEALLYFLNRKGLHASIGGTQAPHLHRILTSIDEKTAQSAVSFSLSRYTTETEIDQAVQIIHAALQHLRPLTADLF